MKFQSKLLSKTDVRNKAGTPHGLHERSNTNELNYDEDDVEVTSTSGFYGAAHGKYGVITEDDVS